MFSQSFVCIIDANAPIYTISGTRVSNESTLAPGIYIRGGKKFIVR